MSVLNEVLKAFAAVPKEFRDRGQECMYQLQEAAKAFDEFAAPLQKELKERHEQEREEALLACKRQDQVIEEVEQKIQRAEDFAHAANNDMRAAELALRAARDGKPTRFPLKAEITAWEQSVAMATEALANAQGRAQRKNVIVDGFRMELRRAKDKLQELEAKEFALRPKEEQEAALQQGFAPVAVSNGLQGFGRVF